MKEKLKSYEFWVSVVSAVMVVLQSISQIRLAVYTRSSYGILGSIGSGGYSQEKDLPTGELSENNPTQDAQEKDGDSKTS